jgi:hypothetical protein
MGRTTATTQPMLSPANTFGIEVKYENKAMAGVRIRA